MRPLRLIFPARLYSFDEIGEVAVFWQRPAEWRPCAPLGVNGATANQVVAMYNLVARSVIRSRFASSSSHRVGIASAP